MVEKGLIDWHTCGQAADEGNERFAVAFAGCGEAEHESSIIN
jgi:hypothetical protein